MNIYACYFFIFKNIGRVNKVLVVLLTEKRIKHRYKKYK
jgi:hypothetical protein